MSSAARLWRFLLFDIAVHYAYPGPVNIDRLSFFYINMQYYVCCLLCGTRCTQQNIRRSYIRRDSRPYSQALGISPLCGYKMSSSNLTTDPASAPAISITGVLHDLRARLPTCGVSIDSTMQMVQSTLAAGKRHCGVVFEAIQGLTAPQQPVTDMVVFVPSINSIMQNGVDERVSKALQRKQQAVAALAVFQVEAKTKVDVSEKYKADLEASMKQNNDTFAENCRVKRDELEQWLEEENARILRLRNKHAETAKKADQAHTELLENLEKRNTQLANNVEIEKNTQKQAMQEHLDFAKFIAGRQSGCCGGSAQAMLTNTGDAGNKVTEVHDGDGSTAGPTKRDRDEDEAADEFSDLAGAASKKAKPSTYLFH